VEAGLPDQAAGVDVGDELMAIDGTRVTAEQLSDRLRDYKPGDTCQLAFFHQEVLLTRPVTLAEPRLTRYQVVPVQRPSKQQEQNFLGWLGVPLAEIM